jgi:DNA-binding transcriptional regulator of glucitol operon
MKLKEELSNMGLAFVWIEQQECYLREIAKVVQDGCNDIERQNILA